MVRQFHVSHVTRVRRVRRRVLSRRNYHCARAGTHDWCAGLKLIAIPKPPSTLQDEHQLRSWFVIYPMGSGGVAAYKGRDLDGGLPAISSTFRTHKDMMTDCVI